MDESFQQFIIESDSNFHNASLILEINDKFITKKCECKIAVAKNGYVISYVDKTNKRTVANFVTRKTGVKIRIYADHISQYDEILSSFPKKMKAEMLKSSPCKRLLDPRACNSRCQMGFIYQLDGEEQKKCRYSAFMPTVNEENQPYILQMLDHELA